VTLLEKETKSLQSHKNEDWVSLFSQINSQNLFAFDQIGLEDINKIIYCHQDDANRNAIPTALVILKIHNTNCTKESDLIRDFAPYLPYAERWGVQQLLAEIPEVTSKAARDYLAHEQSLKKRIQRTFKRIKPALEYLSKK
jgi:hypothetical protein